MKKIILVSLMATSVLGGCARAKQELGLVRREPDEFAVVKRAPLEIPPNLEQVTALPAPQPGRARPQETSPEVAAQAALGTSANLTDQTSSGESALLQKAGATNGITNIRDQVDREAVAGASKNRPVIKRLMNFGNKDDEGAAVIVDAPAEAERLKANKTREETPSIEQ